jgi:hypothetical protein
MMSALYNSSHTIARLAIKGLGPMIFVAFINESQTRELLPNEIKEMRFIFFLRPPSLMSLKQKCSLALWGGAISPE